MKELHNIPRITNLFLNTCIMSQKHEIVLVRLKCNRRLKKNKVRFLALSKSFITYSFNVCSTCFLLFARIINSSLGESTNCKYAYLPIICVFFIYIQYLLIFVYSQHIWDVFFKCHCRYLERSRKYIRKYALYLRNFAEYSQNIYNF